MSLAQQEVHVSESYARKLTENIRRTAVNAKESIDKLNDLIRQAKSGNAHTALGYKSWTAYLSDTFSETPMLLERDARQAFVAQLSSEGMSVRAIAPIVGASVGTVHADQQVFRNEHVEESAPIPAVEREWSPETGFNANPFTGEVIDAPTTVTETHSIKTVTGLDGKTYTKPEPKADRRRSLVDDAFKANTDLWKAIERIRTIRGDDRFTRNKVDILAALQPSVDLALEILADL